MLFEYIKQTESFLRDRSQKLLNTDDIIVYINRARRDLALRTQSIRRMPPVSGTILTIQVLTPGVNYVSPQVVISAPDFPNGLSVNPGGRQATALAQQIGGQISDVGLTYGGDGYFRATATVVDAGPGTGATLACHVSPIMTLNPFQEVYNFRDFPLNTFPGVRAVYGIFSASVIFNNYRFMCRNYPFTDYQSKFRVYPQQYFFVPTVISQYGDGVSASLYSYPLPNSNYQWEIDCLCLPDNLEEDEDVEALEEPWQDAVPYFAAHMSLIELQNYNYARAMLDLYKEMTSRYSAGARHRLLVNPLGRY